MSNIPQLNERPVVEYKGTYKKVATTTEAIFMITGMTIGAGILGLPYAIAQAGLIPGLIAIAVLGFVVLALNLMIGEISIYTGVNQQLPGLAGKYLGPWAKAVLSLTIVVSGYGVLLAYLVGEGNTLAALLGGNPVVWTVVFWSIGSFLIWGGLQRLSRIERIISSTVIGIITILSLWLLPHMQAANVTHMNAPMTWLLPIGVIIFALHATPAIAEAHALLPNNQKAFRKAVMIGTLIPAVVYLLFTLAVVGVTGSNTSQIATIGLGNVFGPAIAVFANIFAILAMSTGFMGLGTALKDTFSWDHKIPAYIAKFLVVSVPIILFLGGFRDFVAILDLVGGVFISLEAVIMAAVYVKVRRSHATNPGWGLAYAMPVMIVFLCLGFFSVYSFFR